MNCSTCGNPVTDGHRFCVHCGAAVGAAPAAPAAPPPPAPTGAALPPPPIVAATPPPAPAPAPVAAVAPAGPADAIAPVPEPAAAHRSTRKWGTIAAVLVGLAGAGVVGFLLLRGDSAHGAASPKAAVQNLADAISSEDLAAATQTLAPDEIDGLQPLLDAVRQRASSQGMKGLSPGEGLDLSLTVDRLTESRLGKDATLVSAAVSISADASKMNGPLGTLLDGKRSTSFEIDLVTIRLDGGWYISPMLTAGNAIVERGDLPAGDFDLIATPPPKVRTTSAADAVEKLASAAATQDFDTLQDVLGTGEARFLRVFRAAADELLNDRTFSVSVDEARASDAPGGATLDKLRLTVYADGETHEARYANGCLTVDDGDSKCPISKDVTKRLGITEADLVMQVTRSGGNLRVGLVRSLAVFGGRMVDNITRSDVLQTFDLEVLDDATPITADTKATATIADDNSYAVFELKAPAGGEYTYETADSCYANPYSQQEGSTNWDYDYDSTPARTIRIVVQCDTKGETSLTAHTVKTITTDFPVDVSGTLSAYGLVHYVFDVPSEGYYEVVTTGDVSAYVYTSIGSSTEGYQQLPAGENRMDVSAYSGGGDFTVKLIERNPAPPEPQGLGFEDGSTTTTIDLSSGEITVTYYAVAGSNIVITAYPDNGQDITLYSPECSDCSVVDAGGPGSYEEQHLQINSSNAQVSRFSITVSPYSGSDQFGTVTLVLSEE